MADRKLAYASSAAVTCTLASLASDTNLLAGRESAEIDNTTNKYLDYILGGKFTTGTSPTASRNYEVWLIPLVEDATYPDVFDGTDSNETATTRDMLAAYGVCVTNILTTNTSDRTYWWGGVSARRSFGGTLPKKFTTFHVHNTGVNSNSTAGNHAVYHTGVYETIA